MSADYGKNFLHQHRISKEKRQTLLRQHPKVIWFTGLSGSGKSTVAGRVEELLFEKKILTYLIDGDNIRSGLNNDLGFSEADRSENIRRIAEVAKLFVDAGIVVLVSCISPFAKDRKYARDLFSSGEFIEVFVNCPLEVCVERDTKGLYESALKGDVKNFTGVSSAYEAPENPEIEIRTDLMQAEESAQNIFQTVLAQIILH